ncbi:MAG: DUF1329 domain-containing protein, partial [Xanthomonadales bacterium]|nr:DUF1329 domain-containing protein [Xanthomonadales bacterium]
MMLEKAKITFAAALLTMALAAPAAAKLSPEQLARLGTDLTPMGAIRAGNEDGTIPTWEGGITSAADAGFPDFKSGGHHPDPFASDQVQFKIEKSNMAQYADKLTEGHKAMLNAYDSFFMNIYQTRRSAAFPERIYEATRQAAATAELGPGGNGVTGAISAVPFPIPANGLEAIWNHILRYRTVNAARNIGQAAVTRSGDYTLVKFQDEFKGVFFEPGMKESDLNNVILYFRQKITAPARLAGQILLVHETLDQNQEIRKAWLYNPGQRRVRRAPNVAFDNPRDGSDGLMTSDQFDMYNGSPQRYNWNLVGRKEVYVPYNNYKLHSNSLTYDNILKPLHINPELARYELHRVWVVDATLKDGTRHIYKRRTYYI